MCVCVCVCVCVLYDRSCLTLPPLGLRAARLLCPWDLGFPGGSVIKKIGLPMQETQDTRVWSLGWEDPLEEEIVSHSSTLAWEIPQTEEPGGYSPWGCRVGQDLATEITWSCNNLQLPWRNHLRRSRQWQPTPVLLPGKSHGWRSLVGYSPWCR